MVEVRSMFFFAAAVLAAVAPCAAGDAAPGFPAPSRETRPWTVCHVMGGRLDAEDLAREMDRWTAAGFGGARIVPIYGVDGEDASAVPFMSAESVAMLSAAKALADEKNFGIDLSLGAGWCFGGRTVPKNLGIHALKVFKPGSKPPRGAKVLFERDGIRLAEYATGYAVKRTHRVDAGLMMNPFSPAAMRAHLTLFAPLSENASAKPRAAFHDSYEYAHAAWSDELPGIFAKYRGYRIEDHLAELAGLGDSDIVARVKCDWRETLSDILVRETFPVWTAWCRERGILSHNQAHGAPADLLEFYAIADVPETEMFGRGRRDRFQSRFDERFREGDRNILVSKFASSAAHLAGRTAVSAEAFTWLAEHFCETPEEIKAFGDLLFLSGATRLYFHGTTYSPDSMPWPGRCFYASSEINPRNPIWRDLPELNAYFTRVQSVLAEAKPDSDILLYWPKHDLWTDPKGFAKGLSVNGKWLKDSHFGDLAARLVAAGYSFDYISDAFLAPSPDASPAPGAFCLRPEVAARCKAIVVPECRYMKQETFDRLVELSRTVPVVFEKSLPSSTPGFSGHPIVRKDGVAPVPDAIAALASSGARRDVFASAETPFDTLRLAWKGRTLYFVVNSSMSPAALLAPRGAWLLDPRKGTASTLENDMALTLHPAQSVFIAPGNGELAYDPSIAPVMPSLDGKPFAGPWTLEFLNEVSGAPLPEKRTIPAPCDWTTLGEKEAAFAGTARYSVTFDLDGYDLSKTYSIDLGEVSATARLYLNGNAIATLYMHPYATLVPPGVLKEKGNVLEVETTSLAANRIRDYDRRGVKWKVFQNVNVVSLDYKPLDACGWPVLPSGLSGPVSIGSFATPDAEAPSATQAEGGKFVSPQE